MIRKMYDYIVFKNMVFQSMPSLAFISLYTLIMLSPLIVALYFHGNPEIQSNRVFFINILSIASIIWLFRMYAECLIIYVRQRKKGENR